ncbi:MAG: hypothetical protein HFG34_04685 [Eubacterium sp.]|nr:hypothetical protein [Eubacterium sp.]
MAKRLFSSYVSQEVFELVDFLSKREEISKTVVFPKRAIRCFMESDRKIDPRILLTQRTDPAYIERKALLTVYLEEEQRKQLEAVAEEKGCNVSQVFFQAMLDYCALLISMDSSGIHIEKRE